MDTVYREVNRTIRRSSVQHHSLFMPHPFALAVEKEKKQKLKNLQMIKEMREMVFWTKQLKTL